METSIRAIIEQPFYTGILGLILGLGLGVALWGANYTYKVYRYSQLRKQVQASMPTIDWEHHAENSLPDLPAIERNYRFGGKVKIAVVQHLDPVRSK